MHSPYHWYAIHDHEIDRAHLWFETEVEAKEELRKMLRDEPEWVGRMEVVEVRLLDADRGWMN